MDTIGKLSYSDEPRRKTKTQDHEIGTNSASQKAFLVFLKNFI